ncbi:MAG: pantoate--beta-alanine ligase [Ignavibacteriae bacterium]|nr:pantoate--beta-alanine ligase [Ignavibacteriota bacterium]
MKVIREIKPMQEIAEFFRRAGKTVGFVPTMGFLHEGHVALMLAARDECDVVIASIFVNPTQFLPNEDFAQYPRDFLRDFYICKQAGVDYIFNPSAEDMYGENYKTYVNVEDLSEKLEGKYRPGHFKGVATVVLKLFNICKPHYSYFGQKDAQQVSMLKKTVKDLNLDVTIRICETIREDNGLAKSSRNTYLSEQQKEDAAVINQSLQMAKEKILANNFIDAETVKKEMKDMIEQKAAGSSVQYVAITDNELLNNISDLKGFKGDVLISLAVYFGKTRLIDNILFTK